MSSSLKNKTICFTGTLQSQTRAQASKAAVAAGAKVAKSVTNSVDIVVCADGAGAKKKQAEDKGCEIWTEDEFLAAVGQEGDDEEEAVASPPAKKKKKSPPSTPASAKKPPATATGGKKKTKIEPATPAVPGSSKRKVMSAIRDGNEYSVHEDFDVKLMLSDQTTMNSNKFYKLQLLVHNDDGNYYVATNWGRLGEPGQSQLKGPHTDEAVGIKEFAKVFRSKTKNDWGATPFVRHKDKYQLVETTVDDDDDDGDDNNQALGRLTESQIQKGQAVLKDIRAKLEENEKSSSKRSKRKKGEEEEIGALSNSFYSLIPTRSGRQRPPLLDNLEIVTEKEGLLEFWLRMGFEEVSPQDVDGSPISGVRDLPLPTTLTAAASNVSDKYSISESQSRGKDLAKAKAGDPVDDKMDPELYGAILLYTGNSIYRELNRCLRVEWKGAKKYWKYLRLYFEAMDHMPKKEVTLWRGIAADLYDEYVPGKIIKWWTVSSCTSSKDVAENFMSQLGGKATLLTLKTKTACDISALSFYPHEQESLLSPGVKLRVLSRKRKGNVAEIEVEEVLDDDDENNGDKKPAAIADTTHKKPAAKENRDVESDNKLAAVDEAEDEEMEDVEAGEGEDGDDDNNDKQGLDGMVFAITGALSTKRADFVAMIEENGGVVKSSVTKAVTHLISARDDTDKALKAKKSGVKILKEEDVVAMVSKPKAAAAATPTKRKTEATSTPSSKTITPSKKMGLGGFAAPDPADASCKTLDPGVAGVDSALASRVNVHEEYHARLALVDPSVNSDKYYILQVLVDPNPPKKAKSKKSSSGGGAQYYLFTRWGRTGTGGQCKLDGPFADEEAEAQAEFEKIFKSKTGVAWSQAVAGSEPKPGKYEYLATGDGSNDGEDAQWFYFLRNDPDGKPNGWYKYDEKNNQEVEDLHETYLASNKAARLSNRVVTSETSGFQYRVNLSTMEQTNTSSGTTRPIGRTIDGKPPSATSRAEKSNNRDNEEEEEEKKEEEDNDNNQGQGLDGKVFAITGALSMKRADFVALIEENGGVVKGSVTKDVTHLISARDDTAKAKKAKASGVEIVKEEEVIEMINTGGGRGAAEGPILHLFTPCSSEELAKKSSGTGWTFDGDDPIYEERQYPGMETAPPKARQLAQRLQDAVGGHTLPACESDTEAIVVVISNLPFDSYESLKGKERSSKKRMKVLETCFLDALGLKQQAKDLADSHWVDMNAKRECGFCYEDGDRDEDEEEDDGITKGTAIMADSLEDCFEFNFDCDELCVAPVLYGGMYDNCIVGVLSMRVCT